MDRARGKSPTSGKAATKARTNPPPTKATTTKASRTKSPTLGASPGKATKPKSGERSKASPTGTSPKRGQTRERETEAEAYPVTPEKRNSFSRHEEQELHDKKNMLEEQILLAKQRTENLRLEKARILDELGKVDADTNEKLAAKKIEQVETEAALKQTIHKIFMRASQNEVQLGHYVGAINRNVIPERKVRPTSVFEETVKNSRIMPGSEF